MPNMSHSHQNLAQCSATHASSLHCEFVASTSPAAMHLVFIHGWGFSSRIWLQLAAQLKDYFHLHLIDLPGYGLSDYAAGDYELDKLLDEIAAVTPGRAIYCGWSLGANLILQLAKRSAECAPEKVQALISIASNPKFISTANWPGVHTQVFTAFNDSLQAQDKKFLPRFASLCASGTTQNKALVNTLKHQLEHACKHRHLRQAVLLESLGLTASIDSRQILNTLKIPQLYILGAADKLADSSLHQTMMNELEEPHHAHCQLIADAPHAVFLSHQDAVIEKILTFFEAHNFLHKESGETSPVVNAPVADMYLHNKNAVLVEANTAQATPFCNAIDKKLMAMSFNEAAKHYDAVAGLQREVVENLIALSGDFLNEQNGYSQADIKHLLDLGCGTGYASAKLHKLCKDAAIYNVDIAHNMLSNARQQQVTASFIQADFDHLPLRSASIDFIFSSLALQWSINPQQTLAACKRVLATRGVFAFSSLLDNTLFELRNAWKIVDSANHTHVNSFLTEAQLRALIDAAGFKIRTLQRKTHRRFYAQPVQLMRELKQLGAHNVTENRPKGLASKHTISKLTKAYAQYKTAQGFPASYDVVYLIIEKA